MKGLFIGDNIRLIDGIVYDTAAENLPGLLLFSDFEKAFDTVECSSIQKKKKHLKCLALAHQLSNGSKMCYNNIESFVLNNGWSTVVFFFFNLGRGVRQGCPLSPYFFVLCVEVLAEKIRKTKSIKRIL